jgi:hypothetical protein
MKRLKLLNIQSLKQDVYACAVSRILDGYQLAVGHCSSLENGKTSPRQEIIPGFVRARCEAHRERRGSVRRGARGVRAGRQRAGRKRAASIDVDIDPGQCGIKSWGDGAGMDEEAVPCATVCERG